MSVFDNFADGRRTKDEHRSIGNGPVGGNLFGVGLPRRSAITGRTDRCYNEEGEGARDRFKIKGKKKIITKKTIPGRSAELYGPSSVNTGVGR